MFSCFGMLESAWADEGCTVECRVECCRVKIRDPNWAGFCLVRNPGGFFDPLVSWLLMYCFRRWVRGNELRSHSTVRNTTRVELCHRLLKHGVLLCPVPYPTVVRCFELDSRFDSNESSKQELSETLPIPRNIRCLRISGASQNKRSEYVAK